MAAASTAGGWAAATREVTLELCYGKIMQQNPKIRILLADDHMVVRKGLIHVLGSAADIEIIAEAESGEEALFLCQKHKPDIVVMDVQMDGLGGIEATRLLIRHHSAVRVIGLSTFADPKVVSEMIAAGARGYLLKDISADELAAAVRAVYNGQTIVSEGVTTSDEPDRGQILLDMGKQQRRVLALLTKGLTNPEIAEYLGVSMPTARYHVTAIFQKLDVSNRAEAVAVAVRKGLVSEDDL